MEYNEENLQKVINAIKSSLTVDLLPLNMRKRNVTGRNNHTFGHCHTTAGVIYKIFGPKNVHMWRGLDDENIYHWWILDKNGKIIDPTADQYTALGKVPPYSRGEKAGMLGFGYKKRVGILLSRVKELLDI